MKECDECEGQGWVDDWHDAVGWDYEHTTVHEARECYACDGTGEVEPEPEEPPPHTDADAPADVVAGPTYCPTCLRETPRCSCEPEVDEERLREAIDALRAWTPESREEVAEGL